MTSTDEAVDTAVMARQGELAGRLDRYRGRSRSISVRRLLERTAAHQGSPYNTAQRLELETTMAGLTSRERACVILRYCEDKSPAEIAAALGIPEDMVKKHLGTAVRRLAAVLGPLPDRQIEPLGSA